MRVEIPVNRDALLETVRTTYGLNFSSLEYLGLGMVNAYRTTSAHESYLLKLFPNTPYGREAAARLDGEHALLIALRSEAIVSRIPWPVRALSGASRASFGDMAFALYDWIEGETLWGRTDSVLESVAGILARLHAGAPKLLSRTLTLPLPEEDFGLPFEAELLHDVSSLERLASNARPGVLALRDLMLPRQNELLAKLEHARYFQRLARSRPRPRVVAHTDMHGGNLLLDNQGQLCVLDWEMARIAPPEHDLWMFHERLEDFLSVYDANLTTPAELDADVFGFYFYRRTLEDIAVDVRTIVNGDSSDEQAGHDLEIIRANVQGWWPHLERDVERVRETLEKRERSTN